MCWDTLTLVIHNTCGQILSSYKWVPHGDIFDILPHEQEEGLLWNVSLKRMGSVETHAECLLSLLINT